MVPSETPHFSTWDYVVFAAMLVISAGIGVYAALTGGRQRTADEVFLGNRRMHFIPVGLSLMVSFVSAISVIGTPAEVYVFDSMFGWIMVSHTIGNFFICRMFVPIFFRLRITSVYEYLEMRFNRAVRLCGTIIFSLNALIYMGVSMYTPALALNAVTGMDLWVSVVSTGVVCIFYTTVGGIKAVLWTDTLQAVIILAGVVAVIVKGALTVGGFGEVWRIGVEGKRINLLETSLDPRVRYTIWGFLSGNIVFYTANGINQTITQRLMSCGSKKKATKALIVATISKVCVQGLSVLLGVVMYAVYAKCDPYTQGFVDRPDQLMPYMVMDLFGSIPGLPGLFLAAVVSASLSTLSSGINALAAVTAVDVIKIIWPKIKPQNYALICKLLTVLYGTLAIGFAFIASISGEGVLQQIVSIVGVLLGSLLGVFLMGIFMHRSNSKGALAGLVTSFLFVGWIKVGAIFYPSGRGRNALSVEGCQVYNATESMLTTEMTWPETSFPSTSQATPVPRPDIAELYAISFLYYPIIAVFVCMTVGMLVSAITGFTDPDSVDPRLKYNIIDVIGCCLPESLKRRMRCGNDKYTDDEVEEEGIRDLKHIIGTEGKWKEVEDEEQKSNGAVDTALDTKEDEI